MPDIYQFPCLNDNYGFLLHDPASGATATIDTPDAAAINAALAERGWTLTHILNTHHHADHAGGNLALKEQWQCPVWAPAAEAERIAGVDHAVAEGDRVLVGSLAGQVLEVPGHTSGHIAWWFADHGIAFVGDTLFALGCGRLFEGTPAQMWTSLGKLLALPDATRVYCAHEYTEANARFALTVEPANPDLQDRAREIKRLRAKGEPTVPTTVALEKATNPFLRPDSANLQATLGLQGAPLVDVFAETRRRKDNFRG